MFFLRLILWGVLCMRGYELSIDSRGTVAALFVKELAVRASDLDELHT
jgi:hypothetical protein